MNGISVDERNALYDSSPVAVYICDPHGAFMPRFVSRGITHLLGWKPEAFVDQPDFWATHIHPDDAEIAREGWDGFTGPGTFVRTYRFQRSDNSYCWINDSMRFEPAKNGKPAQIAGFWTDVTALKEAETHLLENDLNFQVMLENLPFSFTLKSADGRYKLINPKYSEWFGIPQGQAVGKTIQEIAPLPKLGEDAASLDDKVLKTGLVQKMDREWLFPDGTLHSLVVTKFPIRDDEGTVTGIGTINVDITESRKTERALRQAQKMEAVGHLTGGVAHDFNNLLGVIVGNAELLTDELGKDHAHVKAILRATRRGAELTQRLLAFSRQQPLQPRSFDTAQLVEDLLPMLTRTLGDNIEIEAAADPGLWMAMADQGQVENALLNMAINARDAMPGGGNLTIECHNVHLDEDYVALNPDSSVGDYVVLVVSDTGTGMADEVKAHVFEPFFTTKAFGEGSGLGLAMIYGFAQQSGGHVSIYSELDQGTSIKLYLPRGEGAASPAVVSVNADLCRGKGENVLVIEDDPDMQVIVRAMLDGLGYQVIVVPDGNGGLRALERGRVDVVLSDVMLPGGMSGPEFAATARARYPALKIVFMSGYPAAAVRRGSLLEAGNVLLAKPFHRRQLAQMIADAVNA